MPAPGAAVYILDGKETLHAPNHRSSITPRERAVQPISASSIQILSVHGLHGTARS